MWGAILICMAWLCGGCLCVGVTRGLASLGYSEESSGDKARSSNDLSALIQGCVF